MSVHRIERPDPERRNSAGIPINERKVVAIRGENRRVRDAAEGNGELRSAGIERGLPVDRITSTARNAKVAAAAMIQGRRDGEVTTACGAD